MTIPLSFIAKKYWQPCLCDEFDAAITNDGLLYRFWLADIRHILDAHYPHDKYGWFFNASRDRYITEFDGGDLIDVNPQFVSRHFAIIIYND